MPFHRGLNCFKEPKHKGSDRLNPTEDVSVKVTVKTDSRCGPSAAEGTTLCLQALVDDFFFTFCSKVRHR